MKVGESQKAQNEGVGMNRKQRRTMKAKGIDPMRLVQPNETNDPNEPTTVEMKTTIPPGEIPIASIMVIGTKSGKCFVGHNEGQFHAAHALCLSGAQTLYAMIVQQLKKDDERRVMPVPTPMSNLILPPMGGRDA